MVTPPDSVVNCARSNPEIAMRRILTLLLIQLTVLCVLVSAQGPIRSVSILSSTPETSKDGVQVFVKEDFAGTRQLQVYAPVGGNIYQHQQMVRSEEVSARAFDADGKEIGLVASNEKGALSLVCNAESCKAIKIYNFSIPKAETDRVRKVVVVFRNNQYELTIEKSPPPKPAK